MRSIKHVLKSNKLNSLFLAKQKCSMYSFCKVKLITLLATVGFSSADNCQYAPGIWIGDGSLFTPDCPCYPKNP